jgi:hypothetical protein
MIFRRLVEFFFRYLGPVTCVWLMIGIGPTETVQAQQAPRKLSDARIAKLKLDGDRLADQGDFQGALNKYTRAYQGVVASIRGQEFLQTVQPSIFNRQELGKEMLKMVEQEYTAVELKLMDASYKVWGLVPRELDTAALMISMLTEEVAGFYDPDTKRMVLIVEDGPVKKPSWLGSLLGVQPAFDKDEQKTTLAHELTHALQDQLYDLNSLEAGIEDDDDMLLAFSALVEGDATLLMFVEAEDVKDVSRMDPEALRATFNIMSWMLPLAGGKTFRSAPPIFRDSLTFPYFQGMLFALALAGRDGWDGVHHAYRQPPVSTEQILHPAKYLLDVDVPQTVVMPVLIKEQLAAAGWAHLGGNCLGELQTGIMFKRVFGGKSAAAGWDGDRYDVFSSTSNSTENLALVYVSAWDSPKDAEEFATAYRAYRASERASQSSGERPPSPKNKASTASVFAPNSCRQVVVRGDKVWIVEGLEEHMTQAIIGGLDGCRYEEKKFPNPARPGEL